MCIDSGAMISMAPNPTTPDNPPTSKRRQPALPLIRRAPAGRRSLESLRTTFRIDRRTVVGREATRFREELHKQIGSDMTPMQGALVEMAVQLRMRLLVFDIRFADQIEFSAHDSKLYLSWANSLRLTMQALGLADEKANADVARNNIWKQLHGKA